MCPAVPMMSGMLGGCPGNHGGCGERSGGARRQPRCQMAARSSLLRRPTPGARPARRTSSVVAALAALAPRLVRLAHHDYSDGLLALRADAERAEADRARVGDDVQTADPELAECGVALIGADAARPVPGGGEQARAVDALPEERVE